MSYKKDCLSAQNYNLAHIIIFDEIRLAEKIANIERAAQEESRRDKNCNQRIHAS